MEHPVGCSRYTDRALQRKPEGLRNAVLIQHESLITDLPGRHIPARHKQQYPTMTLHPPMATILGKLRFTTRACLSRAKGPVVGDEQ